MGLIEAILLGLQFKNLQKPFVFFSMLIGFMSLIYFFYFPLQKQNCRITSLVVDEYARGNGVGKRLIDHALEKAKSLSCAQLEVTTSLTREATQAYYERSGFIKSSFRYYLDLGI
ncbi:GNAT family N-acetyltransferase [Neptunomonas phycophila]|uniref:GNAT family N-acetyltransferase n=1 Tax=Neptunomonas phycophila TaxID=1572645 RepID=A0ABT9EXT6_9GAMM|nr:GNAT family N-acetyltransferase [Neptunomonas phycophila]MDP2523825.1 GNAT family N-acetyltransferase [Neptunomonas phycophila]